MFVCAKDVNFQSIDIETKKSNWKARNLPRDDLNLVEKIFHVDCFFTGESTAYVLSGFNQILLYDIRSQKKAIDSFSIKMEEEGLLTSFAPFSGNSVVVGNNYGSLGVFDMRSQFKMVKKLNDSVGGITSVVGFRDNCENIKFMTSCLKSLIGSKFIGL